MFIPPMVQLGMAYYCFTNIKWGLELEKLIMASNFWGQSYDPPKI